MHGKIFLITFFLVLLSCGKDGAERDLQYTEIRPVVLQGLVNSKGYDQRNNQTIDKTIYNDKAKASFSLYSDGKIFYEIIGVGSGEGSWRDKGSYLELTADTGLFDMVLEIRTKDNENFEFHYRDRHGFNIVNAQMKNVD